MTNKTAREDTVDVMGATAIQPLVVPITASERCDRCGAQAYVRATLSYGGVLLFCAHHWREHGDAVALLASRVQDDTGRLAAR